MLKSLSAALLLATLLAGCSSDQTASSDANLVASNDFDHLDGWVGTTPLDALTKTQAHSGHYSTWVKPGTDYGMGYGNLLGKMLSSRPSKFAIKGWVMLPDDQANARVITELTEPGKPPLLYDAYELRSDIKKYKEWQPFEHVVTIPAAATTNSQFKTYLWRADSASPVYLDDMQIVNVPQ